MINDGGPVFPTESIDIVADAEGLPAVKHARFRGMTLRDWFAGQALVGLPHLCEHDTLNGKTFEEHVATNAYAMADAMLKAREK